MKRVQLFEFEDFPWFPGALRNSMTNLIVVLHKVMGIPGVISDQIEKVVKEQGIKDIIDLGSGSGGAMPLVLEDLHKKGYTDVKLTMTDLYPNPVAIKKFSKDNNSNLRYHANSVDATKMGDTPAGLKTMVNSFHHMPQAQAKAILVSAQENKQPFMIYEMAENKMPLALWWILLPISLVIVFLTALVMTPFAKPLTWQHLVFTYLIPIIPICYAWDGQASMPRMYTMDDFDELLKDHSSDDYTWEKGVAKNAKGKSVGTYVLGLPKK